MGDIAAWIAHYPACSDLVVGYNVRVAMDPQIGLSNQGLEVAGVGCIDP